MTDATYPALEIDPRKVERLTAYIQRTAHVHAVDPLDWQRRILAGLYVLARMRRQRSQFVKAPTPQRPHVHLVAGTMPTKEATARMSREIRNRGSR